MTQEIERMWNQRYLNSQGRTLSQPSTFRVRREEVAWAVPSGIRRLSIFCVAILLILLCAGRAWSQGGHEYSALEEKTVNYKNWSLRTIKDNQRVDLRSLIQGKKLVMIVYFAPWCGNWNNQAPVTAKLYEKYKNSGFEVVAVGEYASREEMNAFFALTGAPYPVVVESESPEAREKTTHFAYRQLAGDKRRWGSPWNIFLEPSKIPAEGDLLSEKAWVVNGELIEDEVDQFISNRLKASAKVITPCEN